VFSDVVIILPDNIVHDTNFLQYTVFRAVQDMCEVRPFRLVFWLGKSPRDGEDDTERLKGMISMEAAGGGFGPLLHLPVFVSYTRMGQPLRGIDYLLECGAL